MAIFAANTLNEEECHRFSLKSISNRSFGLSNRITVTVHGMATMANEPSFHISHCAYDNAKLLVRIPNNFSHQTFAVMHLRSAVAAATTLRTHITF